MIKLDIINEVVNRTGITKTKAEMAVETVFESMKRALGRGERIELRGFGIFNVRPRKTGIGRNPRTGAEVAIPPGKAVRFKPGKELQTLAVSAEAVSTNGYSPLPAASRTLDSGIFDVLAGVRTRPRHRYWLHALLLLLTLLTTTVVGAGLAQSFAAGRPFDYDLDGYRRMWHDPAYPAGGCRSR